MSGSNISNLEARPANVQLDTLIRVADALDAHVEVRIVEDKHRKNKNAKRAAAGAE
jgi:hypothetical protein